MAKLDFPSFEKHLTAFDFPRLFVDVLGWNNPAAERDWQTDAAGETSFTRSAVAELGGVAAIQIVVADGWPDEPTRARIWKHIAKRYAENLLIFTDKQTGASQSQWYWVRRDKHPDTQKPRLTARRHDYFRGQPVDLFAGKLQAMVVELAELGPDGRLPVIEAARRIQSALDVDTTTKKFFAAYQTQHLALLSHIKGIDNERDKRCYASVLLNRLMFVWFLQKKYFWMAATPTICAANSQRAKSVAPIDFSVSFSMPCFLRHSPSPITSAALRPRRSPGRCRT